MENQLLLFLKPYFPMLTAALAYTLSFGVISYLVKIRREKNSR